MRYRDLSRAILPHLPAAALLACLACQAVMVGRVHSNAYDELAYVGAGYSYAAAGTYGLDIAEHPPLYKALAGAALMPLQIPFSEKALGWAEGNSYRFGSWLLYRSGFDPMRILAFARIPNLVAALLLGIGVYLWALQLFGLPAAYLSLCLFCFEPLIVTHASFVSLDMGVAVFAFFCAWLYERHDESGRYPPLVGAALMLGLGLLTKASMLMVVPALALASAARTGPDKKARLAAARDFAFFLAGGVLVALLGMRLAGATPAATARLVLDRLPELAGKGAYPLPPSFLMGETRQGTFYSYYAVAVLVKSTLPFLILAGLSAAAWPRLGSARGKWAWILAPVFFFLLIPSISHKQLGLRYALAIYPFLCVGISAVAAFSARRLLPVPALAALCAMLAGWHAGETLAALPHTHAYFNELAGGVSGGHRWLVESDLDWGQDMPLLGEYLRKEGRPETITALMTNADLDYWIGPHQDLVVPWSIGDPYSHVNSPEPRKEYLLVSATYRSGCGLYDTGLFKWLDERRPEALLAGSVFVYDVTKDASAHNRLGLIYYALRQWDLALRECRRAASLSPGGIGKAAKTCRLIGT